MQIFLAHAKEDITQVRELYDRLKDKGCKPWLDEKDLLPGQKWREEIPRAIKNSDFIIICLSSNSVAKQGYLQREFKLALNFAVEKIQGTIFLLPVRLDRCEIPDIQLTDYGENLRDFQWVNYYEEDGFERLVNGIEFQRSKITKRLFNAIEIQRSKITNKSQPLNSNPETSDSSEIGATLQRRSQDLIDNIARSQKLLKEFEEALEYASDPRFIAKYQQDITRQKDAIAQYQKEYNSLTNQSTLNKMSNNLIASEIATLAFKKFLETSAGELAKQFSQTAIAKMDKLRQLIWEKLKGTQQAEMALNEIEANPSQRLRNAQIPLISEYLQDAIDNDENFASQIQTLAREINAGKLIDKSSMSQINRDNAKGWQTKVEGGTAYIGDITINNPPSNS